MEGNFQTIKPSNSETRAFMKMFNFQNKAWFAASLIKGME